MQTKVKKVQVKNSSGGKDAIAPASPSYSPVNVKVVARVSFKGTKDDSSSVEIPSGNISPIPPIPLLYFSILEAKEVLDPSPLPVVFDVLSLPSVFLREDSPEVLGSPLPLLPLFPLLLSQLPLRSIFCRPPSSCLPWKLPPLVALPPQNLVLSKVHLLMCFSLPLLLFSLSLIFPQDIPSNRKKKF
jgi:hypothetical protein